MTMNLIGKSKKSEFVWYTLHNDKVYFKIKSKSYDLGYIYLKFPLLIPTLIPTFYYVEVGILFKKWEFFKKEFPLLLNRKWEFK